MSKSLRLGPFRGYVIHVTVMRDDAPVEVSLAPPDLLTQLLQQDPPPHLVVRPDEQAIAGAPPMIAGGVEISLAERLAHLPPEQQARIRAFLAGPVEELLRVADRALAAQADAQTVPSAKVRKYIGQ